MAKKGSTHKPRINGLTIKQRRFLKEYFKSGNGTEAAMKVYNTTDPDSAAAIASQNLSKLKNPVKVLMEQKGISLGKLLDVLDDGLGANRVISAMNTGRQATGATSDFIEVPDYAIRHRYMETAGKWLGVEQQPQVIQQFNAESMSLEFTSDES